MKIDRLAELFGTFTRKSEVDRDKLVRIAESARTQGIPIQTHGFGYDPETGEVKGEVFPFAINDLIAQGGESGVLSSKDLEFLKKVSEQLSPKQS